MNKKDLKELLEEPVVFKHFYKKLDISELKSMDETANGLNESIKECLATNHELSDQLHEKKNRNRLNYWRHYKRSLFIQHPDTSKQNAIRRY